jgi:hypothetical protein
MNQSIPLSFNGRETPKAARARTRLQLRPSIEIDVDRVSDDAKELFRVSWLLTDRSSKVTPT